MNHFETKLIHKSLEFFVLKTEFNFLHFRELYRKHKINELQNLLQEVVTKIKTIENIMLQLIKKTKTLTVSNINSRVKSGML